MAETNNQRQARLAKARAAYRKKRNAETKNEREARLKKARNAYRKKRAGMPNRRLRTENQKAATKAARLARYAESPEAIAAAKRKANRVAKAVEKAAKKANAALQRETARLNAVMALIAKRRSLTNDQKSQALINKKTMSPKNLRAKYIVVQKRANLKAKAAAKAAEKKAATAQREANRAAKDAEKANKALQKESKRLNMVLALIAKRRRLTNDQKSQALNNKAKMSAKNLRAKYIIVQKRAKKAVVANDAANKAAAPKKTAAANKAKKLSNNIPNWMKVTEGSRRRR